jgi:hypothetical protein
VNNGANIDCARSARAESESDTSVMRFPWVKRFPWIKAFPLFKVVPAAQALPQLTVIRQYCPYPRILLPQSPERDRPDPLRTHFAHERVD